MARFNLHVLVVGLVTGIATAGDVWFEGTGFLPGATHSSLRAISADGGIGGGVSRNSQGWYSAFTWTRAGGIVPIEAYPGAVSIDISGLSDDGTVLVGSTRDSAGTQAYRWTEAGGFEFLGTGGRSRSLGTAISGDGHTIVGYTENNGGRAHAFRWRAATGLVDLPTPVSSRATTTNYDGSIIAGRVQINDTTSGAGRWDGDGPPALLGNPPGTTGTIIYDLSDDQSIAVGQADLIIGGLRGAILQEAGWTLLDDLPGGDDFSIASSTSPDGAMVVGGSHSSIGYEAIIWTEAHGMRRLADVLLEDYGLHTDGWVLSGAEFSADGSTIYGAGINPDGRTEGYVVQIPEPATALGTAIGLMALSRLRRGRMS